MPDVLIAGAGPSGWALAAHCSRLGLQTAVVAPSPLRPWPATYGLWGDELAMLPPDVTAAEPTVIHAFTTKPHVVARRYAILDNERLLAALTKNVTVLTGRVVSTTQDSVELADGRTLKARTVVNAMGSRGGTAEQTAYGIVVPEEVAAPIVAPGEAVFMDWRSNHNTFLYAMPLGGGRVLLEETSLARRPAAGYRILRQALAERLAPYGIPLEGGQIERVRFPLDVPRPRRDRVLPFGAAAGFVHPAAGYSVGEAFRLAPRIAAAIAAGEDPWRTLWPGRARVVHFLRHRGLETLLSLSAAETRQFFQLFFDLPPDAQRGYLSGRDDPGATTAAMLRIFRKAPGRLRLKCAKSVMVRVHHVNSG
ncbi:lycopene beta-cyclase [Kibdelosporangium banguiense]|uniref:Lycopene beta-cyclase n=1 Tax=Kibdelosporangium banguiense TaxID=1365924 RepID=A0ABS4TMV9_9PSEU|nr:lycopene cyclase family protein [Kibdelosporangium banguiense]MBP2325738.1 lycopene beta-cyclase [Kibdelosporangium banguiense]